jgi:guanosine-3',5'-bis(diphosphate) 3'-pyrophosphohydrolase
MTRQELNEQTQSVLDGIRLVERARQYALKMHGDQKYGDEPYSVHLEEVETILIEFNHTSPILRAWAWLHDLEDIFKLDSDENRALFYKSFMEAMDHEELFVLVEAVTLEPGKNRKERAKATYPKIVKHERAIIGKLADRLANGRRSKAGDPGKYSMYKKEYPAFRAALFTGAPATMPMWIELDRLFEYTHIV